MMFWYGSGMGGWGYAAVTIAMVVFWAAVIYAAVALIRNVGRGGPQAGEPPPPQAKKRLTVAVRASGTTHTEIFGAGPVVAATVIGEARGVSASPAWIISPPLLRGAVFCPPCK